MRVRPQRAERARIAALTVDDGQRLPPEAQLPCDPVLCVSSTMRILEPGIAEILDRLGDEDKPHAAITDALTREIEQLLASGELKRSPNGVIATPD